MALDVYPKVDFDNNHFRSEHKLISLYSIY